MNSSAYFHGSCDFWENLFSLRCSNTMKNSWWKTLPSICKVIHTQVLHSIHFSQITLQPLLFDFCLDINECVVYYLWSGYDIYNARASSRPGRYDGISEMATITRENDRSCCSFSNGLSFNTIL